MRNREKRGHFHEFSHEYAANSLVVGLCGGEGGIRTPGTLPGTPVFKTGAINHSATSPQRLANQFISGAKPSPCRHRRLPPSPNLPEKPGADSKGHVPG